MCLRVASDVVSVAGSPTTVSIFNDSEVSKLFLVLIISMDSLFIALALAIAVTIVFAWRVAALTVPYLAMLGLLVVGFVLNLVYFTAIFVYWLHDNNLLITALVSVTFLIIFT